MRSRMWLHLCERRGGLLSEIEPLSVDFNPFELYQHQWEKDGKDVKAVKDT